jgi:hypothetical protein
MNHHAQFPTPLGWMKACWDEGDNLTALSFSGASQSLGESTLATALSRQLHAYAMGERREFTLALKPGNCSTFPMAAL